MNYNPVFTLNFDGLNRSYELHLPTNYGSQVKLPILFDLHGGMSCATVTRQQMGFDALADQFSFIVCYPNGTGPVSGHPALYQGWNSGLETGYPLANKVNDTAFLNYILQVGLAKQGIKFDSRRVYSTGFSNGAMMTHRWAAETQGLLAAIAPVSGDLAVTGLKPLPTPLLYIQGLLDTHCSFNGGIGVNAIDKIKHTPTLEVLGWWQGVNGTPFVSVDTDTVQYTHRVFTGATRIELILLKDGGHEWPGGTIKFTTDPQSSYPASLTIWNFLKNFTR